MAEYINKEKAKQLLVGDFSAAAKVIDKMETEDVAPVVHGKWETTQFSQEWSDGAKIYCECSNCEKLGSSKWKFCPNCGAKMDLK